MGFLDSLAGLFGRPRSLTAAAESSVPPTKAEGIDGGGNMGGRLFFEFNEELRDSAGYGRAGTYEVGQWQLIAMSNPFVTMGLDHLLRPVAAARVDVEPAKFGIPDAIAKMHAEFISWALTEHFQLSRLSKVAAAGFLLSGFALFEPLAELVPYQRAEQQVAEKQKREDQALKVSTPGEVWALADCPQRLPNSLDPSQPWLIDDNGRLIGIRQLGPVGMRGKWERPVLSADRALLFSWKREAGNFAGQSQLRSCWYLAGKVMPTLLKMIGVTLQREGPGLPQATAVDKDAKLTPAQREELIEVYADISAHEASGLVMPAGWKTEWTFSPVSNKGHILQVVERMGLFILQQFGAQQLVIGTGEVGSRSAGETHDARSMAMVEEVLQFLADGYNGARREADGLVKKLIDWNFGPQPAYPKVKLTAKRSELGPQEMATAAKTAKDAGLLTVTAADENVMRERLSLPPITEEERDEAKRKAAALAPQLQPGAESDEDGAPGPGKPFGKKPPALSASAPREWKPWRALRASESKLKLNELDAFFTQSRERFAMAVMPEVLAMLGTAGPALERAMADGKLTPEEVAAIPLDTKRLDKVLTDLLAKTRAAGAAFAREELAGRPLTAAADDDEVVTETDALVNAAKNAVKRRIENRVRAGIEREAIDVLRTGGNAQEVVSRTIARQLDLGSFKTDAGSVTTKVFSVGREEAARLLGGVASVEYTSVLDSATCDPCRAMDGRTAEFGSAEHDAMLPPNRDCAGGDNCRCLLVLIPAGGDE